MVGLVKRSLKNTSSKNHRTHTYSRHLMILHIVSGHIGSNLYPFGELMVYLSGEIELVQLVGLDDSLIVVV